MAERENGDSYRRCKGNYRVKHDLYKNEFETSRNDVGKDSKNNAKVLDAKLEEYQ